MMSTLDRITHDAEIMGGKACIRRMRVTVGRIVGQLGAGHSIEAVLAAYPYLEREDILQALRYAARRLGEPEAGVEDSDGTPPRAREHRFVQGAGEVGVAGKFHYPDFLLLCIQRSRAITFALNILRPLEYPRPDAGPLLEIPLFGELVYVPESED